MCQVVAAGGAAGWGGAEGRGGGGGQRGLLGRALGRPEDRAGQGAAAGGCRGGEAAGGRADDLLRVPAGRGRWPQGWEGPCGVAAGCRQGKIQ